MYRVLLRPSAQRFLRKLRDTSLTARLVAAMRGLTFQYREEYCSSNDDYVAGYSRRPATRPR